MVLLPDGGLLAGGGFTRFGRLPRARRSSVINPRPGARSPRLPRPAFFRHGPFHLSIASQARPDVRAASSPMSCESGALWPPSPPAARTLEFEDNGAARRAGALLIVSRNSSTGQSDWIPALVRTGSDSSESDARPDWNVLDFQEVSPGSLLPGKPAVSFALPAGRPAFCRQWESQSTFPGLAPGWGQVGPRQNQTHAVASRVASGARQPDPEGSIK